MERPVVARNPEEAVRLKMSGTETIIVRDNDNEVLVITRSPEVLENIRKGMNWSMGHSNSDMDGYFDYVYTRLNEEELVEHLQDPSRFQGSDD